MTIRLGQLLTHTRILLAAMPKWLHSDTNGDIFHPTNEENPSPVTISALVVAFVTFVFGPSFVYL